MKHTIEIKFQIGDIVYLKTDVDQLPYLVVRYNVDADNIVTYSISQGHTPEIIAQAIELDDKADVLLRTSN